MRCCFGATRIDAFRSQRDDTLRAVTTGSKPRFGAAGGRSRDVCGAGRVVPLISAM